MRWFVGWRMHVVHAAIALSVGAWAGGFAVHKWYQAEAAKELREQLQEANEQIEREQVSDDATQRVAEDVAERTDRVRVVTRDIIKEVPVYVDREDDQRCLVNRGFVRLHDAAARGTPPVPDSPGEPNDAPSGIGLSTVAATVAGNYGECRVWREQVIGWQEWYATQRSLWATGAAPGAAGGQ